MKYSVCLGKVDHTSECIASGLHAVQMNAYAHEASLINAVNFPPLSRTVADIRECEEVFTAAYIERELVAAISHTRGHEGFSANIASLTVDPKFHRLGIARKLMEAIVEELGCQNITVETAVKNVPAITLYKTFGFMESSCWFVADANLELMKLCRISNEGKQLLHNAV